MDNIDPNMIDKMRRFAAGGEETSVEGGEEFGMPLGEGVGKLSPDEIAAGREMVKTMDPEVLDAMLSLPEPKLIELITIELKKNGVDDVDVPDIIDIIRDIRDEKGGGANPMAEELPGPEAPVMPGGEDAEL